MPPGLSYVKASARHRKGSTRDLEHVEDDFFFTMGNPGITGVQRFVMRRSTILLLVVLLSGMLLEGCICETGGVNRGDINLISLEQEWQFGQELAAEIREQADILHEPVVQKYVEQMGRRIVAVTELSDRSWEFHVVGDSSVNAFNIPGGHVFVNSGLILAANTPSELAGVVAHEVAHGVARHSTEQMTKAYGVNLIFSLVAGERVTLLEQIAGQLLGAGAMAKFSRDDEREADRLGLDYMAEAAYDAEGMAAMFESMLRLRERRPNLVEQFFSTHPLTEERVAEMEAGAEEIVGGGDKPDAHTFERVQQLVGGKR